MVPPGLLHSFDADGCFVYDLFQRNSSASILPPKIHLLSSETVYFAFDKFHGYMPGDQMRQLGAGKEAMRPAWQASSGNSLGLLNFVNSKLRSSAH